MATALQGEETLFILATKTITVPKGKYKIYARLQGAGGTGGRGGGGQTSGTNAFNANPGPAGGDTWVLNSSFNARGGAGGLGGQGGGNGSAGGANGTAVSPVIATNGVQYGNQQVNPVGITNSTNGVSTTGGNGATTSQQAGPFGIPTRTGGTGGAAASGSASAAPTYPNTGAGGAGGGGGGATGGSVLSGGGGGAGLPGEVAEWIIPVVPGQIVTVNIGISTAATDNNNTSSQGAAGSLGSTGYAMIDFI